MSEVPPTSSPPPGARPLWGSHTGVAAPASPRSSSGLLPEPKGFGGEPLDPLGRRLMYGVRFLSLLLLLVLVNSFVNGNGESALNPVAQAAERAEKTPGARFALRIVYSSPATTRSITAHGSGVYNARTERSRVVLKINSPLTGAVRIVSVGDGDYDYTSGDIVEEELPPGKNWVRTESGVSQDDETPLDMEDSLQMLCSSGGVHLVGREAIDGRMTRHYRGDIDLGEFVGFLREEGKDTIADAYERIEAEVPSGISAEGWVDRKELLRRFRMVIPMPGEPGEPPLMVDLRMDLFDYGIHPKIQLPNADRVVDGPLDDAATSGSFS